MSLRGLQQSFAARLLDTGTAPGASSMDGMSVYANAYRSQLLACLRDVHAKTHAWIGDDAFDKASGDYIKLHRPRSWSLDDYGDMFASFLAQRWPDEADVSELAWLDWTLRRAFAGADAPPVDVTALADIDWEGAVLSFVPTLRFRQVQSNVAAIWRSLDDDTIPGKQPGQAPPALRVWRDGFATRFASMTAVEATCLDLATMGATFGEISADVASRAGHDSAVQAAGAALGSWLRDGMIIAVG